MQTRAAAGWAAIVFLAAACDEGSGPIVREGLPRVASTAPEAPQGRTDVPPAVTDAGATSVDAGTPPVVDAGTPTTPDAGFTFGTPGPWPVANGTYSAAQGIQELPVAGFTTDETQNRWVATNTALYLFRPGSVQPRRYTGADGLHLMENPVAYCDSNFGGGDRSCPIYGGAAAPGISTITGGGPDEVFVGYFGNDDGPGDWSDPNRHTGKIDRVRVRPDGTLEVVRFDVVANAHGAMYWHNRTVMRLLYDHFIHKHELYAGFNHGVARFQPDLYRPVRQGEWFDTAYMEYMADHLHARVCYHAPC
jgi:hypothetical protein